MVFLVLNVYKTQNYDISLVDYNLTTKSQYSSVWQMKKQMKTKHHSVKNHNRTTTVKEKIHKH